MRAAFPLLQLDTSSSTLWVPDLFVPSTYSLGAAMEPSSAWHDEEDTSEDKQGGDFAWGVVSKSEEEGTVWRHIPASPVVPWEPATVPSQREKIATVVFNMATARIEEGEPCYIPLGFEEAASKQPDNKRNKVKAWDGASGSSCRTNPKENLYRCDFCQSTYDKADKLANVDGNMGFRVSPDPFLYKVQREMGVAVFQNMFTNPKVACMKCCQTNHNPDKPYFTYKEDGTIKLESKWQNKRQLTRHVNLRRSKLDNVLKNLAKSAAAKGEKQYTEAWMREKYLAFQKSGNQAAVDWVTKLNIDCHVIYYCVHCHTAPTAHNKWYRCTGNPLNLNKPDQFSGKCGHWRCAICLGKHRAEHREFMLFVIGNRKEHFIAFMGKSIPQNENKLALLKTFKLLAKIGDADISTKTIISALQELQAESEAKFGCFPEIKRYLTQDPNTLDNVFGYSEHPCLSLMKAGGIIEAFDMAEVVVPMMSPQLVEMVIEVCFACMDMGECPSPILSKKLTKLWWEMARTQVSLRLKASMVRIEANDRLTLPGSSEDGGPQVLFGCQRPPPPPPHPQAPLPPPVDEPVGEVEDGTPSSVSSTPSVADWDPDDPPPSDHSGYEVVVSTYTSANKIPRGL